MKVPSASCNKLLAYSWPRWLSKPKSYNQDNDQVREVMHLSRMATTVSAATFPGCHKYHYSSKGHQCQNFNSQHCGNPHILLVRNLEFSRNLYLLSDIHQEIHYLPIHVSKSAQKYNRCSRRKSTLIIIPKMLRHSSTQIRCYFI